MHTRLGNCTGFSHRESGDSLVIVALESQHAAESAFGGGLKIAERRSKAG